MAIGPAHVKSNANQPENNRRTAETTGDPNAASPAYIAFSGHVVVPVFGEGALTG
jgi:hypothetical protein